MGNGFVLFGNSPDVSQRGLNYTCLCNASSDLERALEEKQEP